MLLYQIPHNAYTEVEYLYVSGKWSLPAVTGTTPPPLEGFSFTKVDHRRAVVYGGTTRGIQALGDAYVLQLDTWVCVSLMVTCTLYIYILSIVFYVVAFTELWTNFLSLFHCGTLEVMCSIFSYSVLKIDLSNEDPV